MNEGVIELNGKRYDAYTGEYLGKSDVVPKHIKLTYSQGRVIDGFVRPEGAGRRLSKKSDNVKESNTSEGQSKQNMRRPVPGHAANHPNLRDIKHVKAHNPQHSRTLMRRAVHRPSANLKPQIKVQAPAELATKPDSRIALKSSALSIDPTRRDRSKQVGRHQTIRHFLPYDRPVTTTRPIASVPVIAVKPAPEGANLHPSKWSKTNEGSNTLQDHTHHHGQSPHDHMIAAMHRATSHQEPAHHPKIKRRRRFTNVLALIATFLVIGGFIGYLNLPGIEMRVASFKAGFSASLPGYTPDGYALDSGPTRTGSTVSLRFSSGEQSFRLTQQLSSWNSQTLLDNTLALGGGHETVHKNGQTIYIYDDGKSAAWVNGGIRYDLSGNAELSNDQIAQIATSL